MARILAYNSPTPGHVFPAAGMLLELQRRGHEVHLRTSAADVETLGRLGLRTAAVDPAIEAIERHDWQARSQAEAQRRVVEFYRQRAELEIPDLGRAMKEVEPDVLVIDIQTEGAAYVAEASGLPWASYCPYPPAFRSKDAPVFGLGLAPARGRPGRLRDRMLMWYVDRLLASQVAARHESRARLGLAPIAVYDEQWLKADRLILFTAEPYEYPRGDWPASVRLVGPGRWEPPADVPPWLASESRPIVLVTASTAYQADERLIATALEAFAGEEVALVATTAATDPGQFSVPSNARLEQFLPHGPIIARAACVISHGGQGTTQRTLAAGVPVCVVPFCRDQFDVARRVEATDSRTWLHHKRLSPERLRAAVDESIGKRAGAERVARVFKEAGGSSAAADAVEDLLPSGARGGARGEPTPSRAP